MRTKGSKGISSAQIKEALLANYGNCTQAAKALGCHRATIWARIKRSQGLRAVQEEAKEGTLDLAENTLVKKIREGNLTATIFFLKCHGRERGYIERQSVEVSTGTTHDDWVKRLEEIKTDPDATVTVDKDGRPTIKLPKVKRHGRVTV